jgi:SAM-dependent methyltransferase
MLEDSEPKGNRGAPASWFYELPGRLILADEAARIGELLSNLFGYYLLQVGAVGNVDMMSQSRILNRSIIETTPTDSTGHGYARLHGVAHALPVASDSVDVVILPHVLEFEARPHDALREAHRVLVPEGHLLISGFNPWSAMGVWRLTNRRRAEAPWTGKFLSLNRLKDWLALLGFEIESIETLFFRPPLHNERLLGRLEVVEKIGRKLGGMLGCTYVLNARKKVLTLTPIRPRWANRGRSVSVRLVNPTTRVARSVASTEIPPVHRWKTFG